MLESQNGSRRQHRHLLGIRDRLEGGAHRHLRLAVAHVAAKQAVHRQRGFHVALHVVDGARLIGGFVEFKCILKFPLKVRIGRESMARRRFAFGVESQKLVGHVVNGLAHPRLACFPNDRAETVESADSRRRAIDISESGQGARAERRASRRRNTSAA